MIYATSDIHGYPLDSFFRLLDSAGFSDNDTLFVLGDVIDRNGDGGIAMLRWIMNTPNVRFLLGNHEKMLLSCAFLYDGIDDGTETELLDPDRLHSLMRWMRNGCEPTMNSLQALKDNEPELLNSLLEFLENAPLYIKVSVCGRDFILVHSGFENFSLERELTDYEPDELLWYRPHAHERFFPNIMTVLGHTPTGYRFGEAGKMFLTDTWVDIDVGAASGKAPMLLRLDDMKAFYWPPDCQQLRP